MWRRLRDHSISATCPWIMTSCRGVASCCGSGSSLCLDVGVSDADCCGSRYSVQPNHSILTESSLEELIFADTLHRASVRQALRQNNDAQIFTLRDGSVTVRDEFGVALDAQDPRFSMQIEESIWSSQLALRRWTKSIFIRLPGRYCQTLGCVSPVVPMPT